MCTPAYKLRQFETGWKSVGLKGLAGSIPVSSAIFQKRSLIFPLKISIIYIMKRISIMKITDKLAGNILELIEEYYYLSMYGGILIEEDYGNICLKNLG